MEGGEWCPPKSEVNDMVPWRRGEKHNLSLSPNTSTSHTKNQHRENCERKTSQLSLSLRINCQNQQSEHSARKHNESKQPKKGHVMHQHTNKCTTRYSNFTTCTTKTRKQTYHAINPPQSTGNALGVIHKHTHSNRIESCPLVKVPSKR